MILLFVVTTHRLSPHQECELHRQEEEDIKIEEGLKMHRGN